DLHQLTAGQPLDRVSLASLSVFRRGRVLTRAVRVVGVVSCRVAQLLRRWEEELVAKAADLDRRAKAVASFDRVCVGLDRSVHAALSISYSLENEASPPAPPSP